MMFFSIDAINKNFLKRKSTILIFFLLIFAASEVISMPVAKLSIIDTNNKLMACSLILMVDGPSGTLTIKNNSTTITALNVTADFSNTALEGKVTVNTCSTISPGETCQLTFTPGSSVVPLTSFTIQGTNTRSVTASIQITEKPVISITAPVQQARVVPVPVGNLSLTITNDSSSQFNANDITVTSKASCPNLAVDNSDCLSVAPGASCNLLLSSVSPYVPCTITIGGSNTGNSPTALIAFAYLGGLVFEESGGAGKVVSDVGQEVISHLWTLTTYFVAGAASTTDGNANTTSIFNTVGCTSGPNECAAFYCRTVVGGWDLPAINELASINNALCPNNTIPCNFGSFGEAAATGYWSSTQVDANNAQKRFIPGGTNAVQTKILGATVRCIRSFP